MLLFLYEGYVALLQVLHARQLKVAGSHFPRSEAAIPAVPGGLVSRAVSYLFRGEHEVSVGECFVEYYSP